MRNLIKLAVIFILSACSSTPDHMLTPLEIQSIQSREYKQTKEVVFPSVMSVFQDLGYTVKSADLTTGFISAESAAQSENKFKLWFSASEVSQTFATAFVEEIGELTRVRLNFVTSNQKSSRYGRFDRQDTPVLDVNVYQNAFERIENAIFVRSE